MKIKSKNIGCLTVITILLLHLSIGAWSVIEILSWFGKSIPIWGNAIIGLFTAEFSVPIAIVGWILRILGVF